MLRFFHCILRKYEISKQQMTYEQQLIFLLPQNTVFHNFSCLQVSILEGCERSALQPCTRRQHKCVKFHLPPQFKFKLCLLVLHKAFVAAQTKLSSWNKCMFELHKGVLPL